MLSTNLYIQNLTIQDIQENDKQNGNCCLKIVNKVYDPVVNIKIQIQVHMYIA